MTRVSRAWHLALALVAGGLAVASANPPGAAQETASVKPDFSGRWLLNEGLSDDPEEKLENMRESLGGRGEGGRRGRGGANGNKAQQRPSMGEAQQILRQVSRSLIITHDDPKVRFVESDGHIRTLYSDDRKGQEDNHQIQTKWDENRLVLTIKIGDGINVVESYELRPLSHQLVLNRRIEMPVVSGGRTVVVRLVYDAPAE